MSIPKSRLLNSFGWLGYPNSTAVGIQWNRNISVLLYINSNSTRYKSLGNCCKSLFLLSLPPPSNVNEDKKTSMYNVNTAPVGRGRKMRPFAPRALTRVVVAKQRVWQGWTSDVLIYATNLYNLLKTLVLLALQQLNKFLRRNPSGNWVI